MANYYGQFRSNYFRVKDLEAFKEWCEKYDLQFFQRTQDPELVGFGNRGWEHGFPEWISTETIDGRVEVDLFQELAKHLQDNEVAIVMEVGQERLRYFTGYAIAVNAAGERLGIDLTDIYSLVEAEWGVVPTQAVY